MAATIQSITALEILDSRGNPTVEAEVCLSDGTTGVAAVPSGASTGIREALELRDGDSERYGGKGVRTAVSNVNTEIANCLQGRSPFDQQAVDESLIELDGTPKKSRLGANAILSVSMATLRAAANSQNLPLYRYLNDEGVFILPVPYMNILNGGAHSNNLIDVQEYMVVPVLDCSFHEALRVGVEIYHALRKLLDSKGFSTAVGDEGGFAPNFDSNEHALNFIVESIELAGYEPGSQVSVALDVASSELVTDSSSYNFASENLLMNRSELIERYESWINRFPIVSIEDGMAEQDWTGWAELTKKIGDRVQLVGDDVFVTDANTLERGIDDSIGNAILVKLNQVGTVSETLQTVAMAQKADYGVMISHRSGETEDCIIADLAVATSAGQIKTGAPCRSDRTAKYNRLLKIQSELE